MKKMMLHTILLCCLCLTSCSDSEENRPVLPPDQEQEEPETPDRLHDYTGLMNKTNSVLASNEQEAGVRLPTVDTKIPSVSRRNTFPVKMVLLTVNNIRIAPCLYSIFAIKY